MEAFVWAATDAHLGVCISTRVFGSVEAARVDAQEAIGDACPITWTSGNHPDADEAQGNFVDSNGSTGYVAISPVKVRL